MAIYGLVIIKSIETCFSPHGKMMTMLNKKESTEHFSNERARKQTGKENA
jgi:hypothetical protein